MTSARNARCTSGLLIRPGTAAAADVVGTTQTAIAAALITTGEARRLNTGVTVQRLTTIDINRHASICLVQFRPRSAVPVDPSVRRSALGCLLLGFVGPEPPPWILAALADGLGGLVLFGSNLGDGTSVRALTDRLRAAAGRDVVVALDEEGGDVTRLDTVRGSASPGAAALGRLDDVAATEAIYAVLGARCAEAGVTVNLAPVADVNLDPQNPVIGLRAFAADADVAARHVAAAVRGIQRSGVASCLKHFPGHGATRTDSHHEVARLDRSRSDIDAVELEPFRTGIAAGTRAVMTAHLLVPALDSHDLATTSRAITTELLRTELGFGGTVVTDALEMKAVSATIGIVDGFVRALAAGADAIETGAGEYPELVGEIPRAVEQALRDGRLTEDRLADAVRRTQDLAAPPSAVPGEVSEVAAGCLEVLGALPTLDRPLVVECRPPAGMASGPLPWSLAAPLAELVPGTDVLTVEAAPADLMQRAAGRSLVLVVRDPQRQTWQQELLAVAARHPSAVVVDAGWPADLNGLPVVRTRGISPGLLTAAARVLSGAAP
jgi:beta-N-acetylhexosaminidase